MGKNIGTEGLPGGDPQAPDPKATRPKDPRLSKAIHRYVDAKRATGTRSEYEKELWGFVKAVGVETFNDLLQVETDQIVRYRNDLQAKGLQPSTINSRLVAVRGLFSRLLREDQITSNPADAELIPGLQVSQESSTEGLSPEEVQMILDACDGTLRGLRDKALLMTLYYEGLRRSEASKLRWRDLTTKKGLLEIRDSKNNPYATIRLQPEVRRAIEDYHEVLNRELRRRETRPEDPVFTSLSTVGAYYGKRLAPSSINKLVKDLARKAGITRRISAHSFRHTCTTVALGSGAPLHQVQRHLRHKDVRTTLRYDRDRDVRKNPTLDMIPKLKSEY